MSTTTQGTEHDVEARLAAFICELAGLAPGAIASDTELLNRGVVASLQVLEIADFLEREFGTALSPLDVSPDQFRTVATIAELVRAKT